MPRPPAGPPEPGGAHPGGHSFETDPPDDGPAAPGRNRAQESPGRGKPHSFQIKQGTQPKEVHLSNAMTRATAPSTFSVDFSLSIFRFPAGSVRTKALSIFHRSTGCPPWFSFRSSTMRISSLVGGDISRKPCPKGTMLKPSSSRVCTIMVAFQRS